MIRAAQTAESTTSDDSLSACMSMAFAAHIVEAIKGTPSNRHAVRLVLRIQEEFSIICPCCKERRPVSAISRWYARGVCNLARCVAFDELVQELKKRFNDHLPRCPRCGRLASDNGE